MSLDVRYYLRILIAAIRASFWRVLISCIIVAILAFLYTRTLQPLYRASAVMHIAPQDKGVFDLRQLLAQRRDPAFQQTQIGIIKSRRLIRQVVEEEKLHEHPVFAYDKKESLLGAFGDLIGGLVGREERVKIDPAAIVTEIIRESLLVVPRRNSYLVDVSIQLPSPQLAARVVNAVGEIYIESVYQDGRDAAQRSEEWLLGRLQTIREQLESAELELQEFKEQENIVGNSAQTSRLASQEMDLVSSKLIDARDQRLALEALYQQIVRTEREGGDLLGISAVQTNALVQNVRNDILRLQQRRSELSKRYGPEHRQMVALVSEIESAERNLVEQTNQAVQSIKAQYDLAKKNESFMEGSLTQSTGKAQSFGRKQFKLLNLEQNVQTQREIFEAFLDRLNKSEATGENLNTNVSMTDPAIPPLRPISSKRRVIIFIAVFLTAAFGFAIALLKELFDNTLVSSSDVEVKLSEPLLGVIPQITEVEASEDNKNIAYRHYFEHKNSAYAESIRTLRSSLMLSAIDRPKQRYLVTSTQPSEGKTSLAIGVAMAFGQVKKTLLIDGDLRRPSLQSLIDDQGEKRPLGLSDLTIGTAEAKDCIRKLDEFGFDLLPSGTVTPSPQELFCSTNFARVLSSLSNYYEAVVIDSPPSSGLSDAHLLSAHVDAVIYVAKAKETPIPRIRSSIQRLKAASAPVKGVVLSQVSESQDAYDAYYYSNYGMEEAS